jgi:hypothetical protein
MDKQIEELLRLLNKGVEHLPDTVNVIVQQYAINHWVLGGFEFVVTAVLAIAAWRLIRVFKNEPRDQYGYLSGKALTCVIAGGIAAFLSFLTFLFMANDIASALSPVYSLISSLK